jgi:hypothetical protein
LHTPVDPVAVPVAATITPAGMNISSASVSPALSVGSSAAVKKLSMSDLIPFDIGTVGHTVFEMELVIVFGWRCPLESKKT